MEVNLPLLTESAYQGLYYLGNCYFVGRNQVVKYSPDTGISEVVFSGALPTTYGCGGAGKYIWAYITGRGTNEDVRVHIDLFDAQSGSYTHDYRAITTHSYPTGYSYEDPSVELIQYDETRHRFYVFFTLTYNYYPVAGLEGYNCYRLELDATTLQKVSGSSISWSDAYVPRRGQDIKGYYFGKRGRDGAAHRWKNFTEWGAISNTALAAGVSDSTMTYGLCGFYRAGKVYFVGGGYQFASYNHKLTELDVTSRIKRVIYDDEPFSSSYALDGGDTYYVGAEGKVVAYKFVPYENTFTVYDSLGAELATLSDVPSLKSVSLHAEGEYNQNAALTLVDVFDHVYTLYFQPTHTSASNSFIGLSTGPGAPPSIMVGQAYDVPLESTSFYVVYGDPTPQNVIVGYQMSCEKNVVYKDSLTEVARYSGTFRSTISVTDPVFTITNLGMPAFNYIWIKSLGRYYFVTDIVNIRANLWEIHAHVDVLYTYRNAINGLKAHVTRSSRSFNTQLVDAALPTPVFSEVALQSSYLYEGEENPLSPLQESGYHYLLTAIRRG